MGTVRRIHVRRHKAAQDEKERRIKQLTDTPEKAEAYYKLRRDNTNDQVTSLVLDNKEKTRILEHRDRLVQQIYPIYADPNPANFFDFRTLFYLPTKYFAGKYYETLYFNVVIMWMMTLALVITLYYDVLRKLITIKGRFRKKNT